MCDAYMTISTISDLGRVCRQLDKVNIRNYKNQDHPNIS